MRYLVESMTAVVLASLFLQNSRSLLLTLFLSIAALIFKERRKFFNFSNLRILSFFLVISLSVTNFKNFQAKIKNFNLKSTITKTDDTAAKQNSKSALKKASEGTLLDKKTWEAKGTEPRLIMILNSFYLFVDNYFFWII